MSPALQGMEAKTVLVKRVASFTDGGMDMDVHSFESQVKFGDLVSKNMILNTTNSISTSLLGGLPRDMEVLTHQFEFSGQGRLLILLTKRFVRTQIGSQQLAGLDCPSRSES